MHGQSGEVEYVRPSHVPAPVFRSDQDILQRAYGPRYRVQVAPQYAVRPMRGPVAQIITGSLDFNNIKVYYQNNEVSSVPAGGQFYLKVGYSADYPGIHPPGSWSTCITCMATDGSVKNYDITLMITTSGVMKLDALGLMTMPSHDITLRLYLWASTDAETQPPNQSLW